MKKFLTFIVLLFSINTFSQAPTHQEVYDEIVLQGILFPEIVIRQAITETACGTTGVGKTRNNLFGFRKTKSYINFNDSTGNWRNDIKSTYKDSVGTWKASVAYYKQWQDRNYTRYKEKTGKTDYYSFIIWIGYAANGYTYTAFLKKIKPKIVK